MYCLIIYDIIIINYYNPNSYCIRYYYYYYYYHYYTRCCILLYKVLFIFDDNPSLSQVVELYCSECSCAVCDDCICGDHEGHSTTPIGPALELQRTTLKDRLESAKTRWVWNCVHP